MATDEQPPAPPADGGLSGLGLILQLAGTVFAALGTMYGLIFLMEGSGWVGLLIGLGVVRSLFHRAAGTELLYGRSGLQDPNTPRDQTQGVRRYVMIAVVHTVLVAAIAVGKFDAPASGALVAVGALLVWPLILAVVMAQPRFKAFRAHLPLPDDKGFEGASILMLIMGLMGTLGTGAALILMLANGADQGIGMLILLVLVALVIRSGMHAHAGFNGIGTRPYDRAVSLAKRYASFGVIVSIGTAAALFLVTAATFFSGVFLMIMACLVWMLMAWPLIIRRFYGDREFADLLEGAAAPLQRRAPDGGLTALGWFLVAQGAMAVSFMVIAYGMAGAGGMSRGDRAMFGSLGMFGGGTGVLPIVSVALQLWAGFELIAVSSRHRIAAQVFAIVGAVIQIYQLSPVFSSLKHMGDPTTLISVFVGVALTLVTPVATFILVNRKIRNRLDLGSVFS